MDLDVCTGHPDGQHEWVPHGFLGPYPVENCAWCNAGAVLPAPDADPPIDVILNALDDVTPVDEGEGS